MDIAFEIAKYLEKNNFGTIGDDIFIGQIPTGVNGLYVLRATGTLENYLPIENSLIDIYTKSSKSLDAVTQLENIKRFIHRMHNTSTANSYIYSMLVVGDVEAVERDNEYAKVYKISLEVKHRAINLIS